MTGDGLSDSLGDMVTGSGEESSSQSRSTSSGSKSERTHVHVKGEFGTETFGPDTGCEICNSQAEGVLVCRNPPDEPQDGIQRGMPLCKDHRREYDAMNRVQMDKFTYKTFE